MTPDEDAVAARIELDAQGRLVPLTREKAAAALRHFARQDPPSRFAVYRLHEDEDGFDGMIVAWGLGYDDHVDIRSVEPGMGGYFDSIRSISFLFGENHQIVWIDPQPEEAAAQEAAV
jgi:hypothetical protein